MVRGLDKFKQYFQEYTSQYVIIGGTACDILFTELGVPFRATKDLDMVLIVEELNPSFGQTFWRFIEDGGYKHRERTSGADQYFRFTDPEDSSFPKMIELFSRRQKPDFSLSSKAVLTPIHIDDSIVSLSAILLDDEYYNLLVKGNLLVNGFSVVNIETILIFKVRAWLDLKERKDAGELIDSNNIKKHKNDIFRLLANITPSSRVETEKSIQVRSEKPWSNQNQF